MNGWVVESATEKQTGSFRPVTAVSRPHTLINTAFLGILYLGKYRGGCDPRRSSLRRATGKRETIVHDHLSPLAQQLGRYMADQCSDGLPGHFGDELIEAFP